MDPKDLERLADRLDFLDERLAYKIRKHSGVAAPTVGQVDTRLDDTVQYVQELREVVGELLRALRSKGS